jgi:hypothetical protein
MAPAQYLQFPQCDRRIRGITKWSSTEDWIMWQPMILLSAAAGLISGFAYAWEAASAGNLIGGALAGSCCVAPEAWELANRWLDAASE